ncbi:uncharacterized protein LOC106638858 [Copidosoma floridanum]|uniref:uncharacterized protein LOC106638858 n=1 Tax=Copidosoma floridanum TaxID=29053 RepID=UPI0006C94445|nr:uncharacterized protein LOC106638858 [Copidosoma floridanum]
MEAHARAPEALTNTKPMDKTWKMWKQEFFIFLKLAGYDSTDSEKKACLLLHTMGKLAHEAMQNMQFESESEKMDYDILIKMFDEYFDPPKRETEERYNFYMRRKRNNESVEAYITDLKEKAKSCNFGDLTESLIRDMVILDIKDKHLRQIMFDAKDLDMDKLTMLYKQFELNTEKMKEVTMKVNENLSEAKNATPSASRTCFKCGISHPPRSCPAFKSTCEKCKEKGHFTQRCNSKNRTKDTSKNYNNAQSLFSQTSLETTEEKRLNKEFQSHEESPMNGALDLT